MSRWFRFYDSALDDPKVQRLSGDLFKTWVNLLCLASRHDGVLPSDADAAFALRKSVPVLRGLLDDLHEAGLIDITETGASPHNWNVRQYKSDVSNERVKRHRERQRNVTCNGDVAPSESETEAETEAETEQTLAKARERAPMPSTPKGSTNGKSGTRLPEGWRPDAAGRAYAAERGIDPDTTADAFADWWLAANGPTALKRDWNAAFRTWCRRDSARPVGRSATSPVRAPRGNDAFYEQLAVIASRDGNDGPVRS